MSKTAFLFPGQGSQKPGMGKDLYYRYPAAKKIFDLFPDVRDLCFNAPEEELKRTEVTQPCLFLVSAAVDAVLKENGIVPDKAAGHSLGEYPALASAGVFDLQTGMELVRKRAGLMKRAGDQIPGTMAAVIGLDDDKVREVCTAADGVVEPVNYNAPGQVVISGEEKALAASLEAFKEKGARMVVPLNVSGAFHSSLLQDIAGEFRGFLKDRLYSAPAFGVVANVDAEYYAGPGEVADRLSRQMCNPVLWVDSVRRLVADGCGRFIEVGPGNVLKGLLKRIDPGFKVELAGTAEAVAALIEKV